MTGGDPAAEVVARLRADQAERVRALVDDDLIEEHRTAKGGRHSDRLERVLRYFRGTFVADLVRHDGPAAEQPVPAAVDGTYPARAQAVRAGSCILTRQGVALGLDERGRPALWLDRLDRLVPEPARRRLPQQRCPHHPQNVLRGFLADEIR